MSYDVNIAINTGAGKSCTIESNGHTYNCSPMFYRAISFAAGLDEDVMGINQLHTMPCAEAYPLLQKAVRHMIENADWHKQHNPKNGWGSYRTALRFLAWICQQCKLHPLAHIKVY